MTTKHVIVLVCSLLYVTAGAHAGSVYPTRIMLLGDSVTASDDLHKGTRDDLTSLGLTSRTTYATTTSPRPFMMVGGITDSYGILHDGHGGFTPYQLTTGRGDHTNNYVTKVFNAGLTDEKNAGLFTTFGGAPDIVCLQASINNIAYMNNGQSSSGYNPSHSPLWSGAGNVVAGTMLDYQYVINYLRGLNPNVKVLVSTGNQCDWGTGSNNGIPQYTACKDAIIAQAPGWSTSASPVAVVDQWTGFNPHKDIADGGTDPNGMTVDGTHLNALGAAFEAQNYANAINQLVSQPVPIPPAVAVGATMLAGLFVRNGYSRFRGITRRQN